MDLRVNDRIIIPAACLSLEFSRAGGPGGQHVNTTDTRVRLRFDLDNCPVLAPGVKRRLRERVTVTREGEVLIVCDTYRSRHRNVEEARDRLAEHVRAALVIPKRRKKTRPTKASQKRRVDGKKRRGQVKRGRGRVREE